jgi:transcriptional regulator with XRE-family HTH domain
MRSVHTPAYATVLQRLRQARKAAGITQVEAAKSLRRPQSYISNCESGERRIDVVELLEFAKLYRQPLAYFVRGIKP